MLSKISRQLAILHIFLHCKVVEMVEITEIIKDVSHKTILRDIKELSDAGLINVVYSKKQNGYVHVEPNCRCPLKPPKQYENKAKNAHFDKLIRLASIMTALGDHTEIPCWEEGYFKDQLTCSRWYRQQFPQMSMRTMQRDFTELKKIGYSIKYSSSNKCYMVQFPQSMDGLALGG